MHRIIKEDTHVNLTSMGYPNSFFDKRNMGMLYPVKFVNDNIVNFGAKKISKTYLVLIILLIQILCSQACSSGTVI